MKKSTYIWLGIALFAAALNLRPAINSISPLIEIIQSELHMNASSASLLTSIPVLCMGIFSPVAAKLANRFSLEYVIGWSLAVIGIGTIIRLFTHTSFFLLSTAFLAGIGIAAASPLLSGFIKKYFPDSSAFMISIYTAALAVGAGMASGGAAPIQHIVDSWQVSLAAWSLLALAAIIIWVLVVLPQKKKDRAIQTFGGAEKLPWNQWNAWLLTFSFGGMSFIFYSLTAWLPPIVENMGYSKIYAANLLVIFMLLQVPANLAIPYLLKKIPSRLFWLVTAALFELIGFGMISLSFLPWLAACFIGLGAGGLFAMNLLLPIDVTTTHQAAASWSAMVQAVGYILGSFGPVILGAVNDMTGSFSYSIFVLIAVNLLMIVMQVLSVKRNFKQEKVASRPKIG
ncbi:MFS transporter [Virgibacillus sp. 7505]|uniref:MFS transporter n=1 Tax=Virgibacillus sp. 7505 TaxID=2022548 RepID=UPI000BA69B13|nr:MFS transporter [Virgibacillus sp. 7505]PAE17832.1 MFS transporter [Virgibacillus sp. 7505]